MESTENTAVPAVTYDIRVRELILKQTKKNAGTETFVYEPATVDEEPLGNLYILGSLKNRRRELDFLPNLVASAAKREFYKSTGNDAETCFEACLKKANGVLSGIAQTHEGLANEVEFCVINIAGETVRFSRIGNAALLLARAGRLNDLTAHAAPNKRENFFSTVVSGAIMQNDKVMCSTKEIPNLFSDKGLRKLFTLSLDEQADIITGLYEKNSGTIAVPDQAAILIEIRKKKTAGLYAMKDRIAFKTVTQLPPLRISFFSREGTSFLQLKKTIARLQKIMTRRNKYLLLGAACAFTVAAGVYIPYRQTIALADIEEKVTRAETLLPNERDAALSLLKNARDALFDYAPPFYLAGRTAALQIRTNDDIAYLHGVYASAPALWSVIPLTTMRFTPRFIFNDAQSVYVFGETPDMFYRIDAASRQGTYALSNEHTEPFIAQRMFTADNMFYFVNDKQKTARVYDPATKEFLKVQKTLAKVLRIKSDQNIRETNDARYEFSGGKIIKLPLEEKINAPKETFLLGGLPPITDFTVTPDGNALYLLDAHGQIFLKQKK